MCTRALRVSLATLASCVVLLPVATAQHAPLARPPETVEARSPEQIAWQTPFSWHSARITVSGPPGTTSWAVPAGGKLAIAVQDLAAWALLEGTTADGLYNYELRFTPVLDLARQDELDHLRSAAGGGAVPNPDGLPLPVVAGSMRVDGGRIVGAHASQDETATAKDVLHYDDVIVTGSLCVGFDCANGESFGYCTHKLKENNLQLCFEDTSTGTFPTNDWKIQINDTTSGGASYFAIWDTDGGVKPFVIEAGAPSASLYVEDYGRVGLGTSVPYTELHIADGDTPTVRLDQDGTSGWARQVWDLAGNETNFFIRDVTNGSKLSFRIQPNTPPDTLTMRSTGNVGIGTWSPAAPLEIETTGRDAEVYLDRTDGGAWFLRAGTDNTFTIGQPGGATLVTLMTSGTVKTGGSISGLSDRDAKQDFEPVDRALLLRRLAALDVSEWSFISEGPGVRHVGPTAQDFQAAFGLGDDDTHIALSDLSGIALAAIQELAGRLAEKDRQIAALTERLAALEVLVQAAR